MQDKFGVRPDQIIDFLALTGDSVDNIPGVPKCGPKTAAKWLGEFGTLDALMARADEVKGKIGESLRASLDILPLSRTLTTIRTDVPLAQGPDDLRPNDGDTGALRKHYERLESRRLLASLDGEAGTVATQPAAAARDAIRDRARSPGVPALAGQARSGVPDQLRYRDHQPRLHAGADRRRVVRGGAGRGGLCPAGA